jgi:hypothetical protein
VVAVSAGGTGGASSMYSVQIESLQTYQRQLTTILNDLQNGQQSRLDHAGTGKSVFGSFPEAVSFSTAFETVRQELINSFGEITGLVEAMIKALGSSASNYQAAEEQIAQQFNAISSQYGYPVGSGSGSGGSGSGSGSGTTSSTGSGTGTSKSTPTSTGPTYALSGSTPAASGTGTGTGTTGQSGSGDTTDGTGSTDGNASAGALG